MRDHKSATDGIRRMLILLAVCFVSLTGERLAAAQEIESRLVHLRNGAAQEWSDFPEKPESNRLAITFDSTRNDGECCFMLHQQDVKQLWVASLNGQRLGELVRDENDVSTGLVIPAGLLKDGPNEFAIEAADSKSPADDIRVGHIVFHRQPLKEWLSQATLQVTVIDAKTHDAIPSRVTVLDANGSLVLLGSTSNDELAIRPGTAFTSTGHASLRLPAGNYTVHAGRGFEYSLATATFTVRTGDTHQQTLSLRHEVPTRGYVACDTHVHTLTHSGHGDATIAEQMITLAGEGIELPIATDHNVHVDYDPIARKLGVRRYFTPVIGNEVTTSRGHFNVFPVLAGSRVPDHKQTDWGLLFDDIYRTPGVKIAILNHARDLHSSVRPFGPALHNAVVGENLEGWPFRFNAMEVVNSGATQTDVMQLFHDWMGLLNRGISITPVGSSDSHDVARFFVGQGRTYTRCDDRDPGNLDVDAAINGFLQGRVMVSYGLLAELTVNGKYSSGELATAPDPEVSIRARVLGPSWVQANRVMLFANGLLIREESISQDSEETLPEGVKWIGSWTIPRPRHDVHLVAIALGPGIEGKFWRTAKPYQPTSADPTTHVIGCSGAVWLDADGDGRRMSARDYAERSVATHRGDLTKLAAQLADYDQATAAQAAHLLRVAGVPLHGDEFQLVAKDAAPHVKAGYQQYLDAWRQNEIARRKP